MSKFFKDYTKDELIEIFNKEKEIQKDIEGMMELSETVGSSLDYFISECRLGVYSFSYYNEEGKVVQ